MQLWRKDIYLSICFEMRCLFGNKSCYGWVTKKNLPKYIQRNKTNLNHISIIFLIISSFILYTVCYIDWNTNLWVASFNPYILLPVSDVMVPSHLNWIHWERINLWMELYLVYLSKCKNSKAATQSNYPCLLTLHSAPHRNVDLTQTYFHILTAITFQ